METLLYILYTINSSATGMRRVIEGNKKFIVVPTTIMLPKVLTGSKGSLYYPPEEIARSLASWNGIPLIAPAHPTLNGQPILGISPQAWARYEVGRFYNPVLNNKNGIDGESWFDEDEVRNKEPRLLDRLNSRINIDVSTGLRHSLELHEPRNHEGRTYEGTVRNFRPDHIAVLMDEKGACSATDGCGILFNASTGESKVSIVIQPTQSNKGNNNMEKDQLVDWLVLNCDCWKDATDKETLNSFTVDKLKKLKEKAQEAIRNSNVVNAVKTGFGEEVLTLNSAEAIAAKITDKVKEKLPTTNTDKKETIVSTTVTTNPTPTNNTSNTPNTPAPNTPMDMKTWLSAMPAEAAPVWNNMVEALNKEKEFLCIRLTDAVTHNSQDEKVRKPVFESYAKLDITVLRGIAAGLPQQTVNNSLNGIMLPTPPVYAGQSGMVHNNYGVEKEPESLGLTGRNPWEWGKKD